MIFTLGILLNNAVNALNALSKNDIGERRKITNQRSAHAQRY